jgi:hypothetical protein
LIARLANKQEAKASKLSAAWTRRIPLL